MILGITASGFAGGLSVSDNFNRADGSLGITPTGGAPWQTLSGTFVISTNKVVPSPLTATSGVAVVDTFASNVNLSLGVSNVGGDAIYFRVVDATNWWRAGVNGVTTSSQVSTSYTEYNWCSYRSGAEYYPTTAQLGAGCQQTYHDHSADWPTRCAWSTNGSTPPASIAYNNYTHSHAVTLAGCGQTVTYSHTHVASHYISDTREVSSGTTTVTTTTATVTLQKSVNNTVTTVGTYQDNSVSSIQVTANGSSIVVKTNQNATTRISTTSSDHLTATKHGLGRSSTSDNGTNLDNFTATPIGL